MTERPPLEELTETPTCPHCGEPDGEGWEMLTDLEDGQEIVTECMHCKQMYTCTCHFVAAARYSTAKTHGPTTEDHS